MRHSRSRHAALSALATLVLAPLVACGQSDSSPSSPPSARTSASPSHSSSGASTDANTKASVREFTKLEREFDARLGVYAVDTGTGRELTHNDDQRFAYNSTFKALAAGAMLRKFSLKGMERVVTFSRDDLIANSPVSEKRVKTGMSLEEMSEAAVRHSDNTAANLMFDQLGGPKGLDAELERIGDDVTRVERREPELSRWTPGVTRDTTTPRAIAKDLRAYVLGDELGKGERALLTKWLRTNRTGDELIRAGVPQGWKVGDKTGTGSYYGARNDIAVVWPPGRAPLVLAILSNRLQKDAEFDNKLLAKAATVVTDTL